MNQKPEQHSIKKNPFHLTFDNVFKAFFPNVLQPKRTPKF